MSYNEGSAGLPVERSMEHMTSVSKVENPIHITYHSSGLSVLTGDYFIRGK